METLITQRLNFAKIQLFKNYCTLNNKNQNKIKIAWYSPNHDSLVDENLEPLTSYNPLGPPERHQIIPYIKNKKTLYFDQFYPLVSAGICYTTDENKIKKYYGNVFASLEITLIERTIRIKGDTLILKVYKSNKKRSHQTKYYKKSSQVFTLSINLKNGNFRTFKSDGKNKIVSFNCNRFDGLLDAISFIFTSYNVWKYIKIPKINFDEIFDNKIYIKTICDILKIEVVGARPRQGKSVDIFNSLLHYFVRTKNIKVPNNYESLLVNYYPTEKYLKKNDRKLIVSILDYLGIKSKITNKIVHEYPNIRVDILFELCSLFGKDYPKYLAMLNDEWFKPTNSLFGDNHKNKSTLGTKKLYYHNRREEIENNKTKTIYKEKILKFLNDVVDKAIDTQTIILNYIQLLNDHIRMLEEIREHDESVNFLATNMEELNDEHNYFSNLLSKIRKGWTIEYQFNKDMLDDVEKPITIEINLGSDECPHIETMTFYPFVLKREEDYVEEGKFMHHCVASYTTKSKSVIISLRTKDHKDRITCEFDAQTGLCLQSRYFCNGPVPGDFDLALDTLKNKVIYYSRRGMLHHTHEKRVPLIVNGKEVKIVPKEPILNEPLFF